MGFHGCRSGGPESGIRMHEAHGPLQAQSQCARTADGTADLRGAMHRDAESQACACEAVITCALRGVRILVAEDCPATQRLVRRILARAGAETTIASNGREAVDAALGAAQAGRAFDFIMMDVQMPVLDGIQATRTLRQAGYCGAIAVMTAQVIIYDQDHCIAAGADAYFSKPLDWPRLFTETQRRTSGVRAGAAVTTPVERVALRPHDSTTFARD